MRGPETGVRDAGGSVACDLDSGSRQRCRRCFEQSRSAGQDDGLEVAEEDEDAQGSEDDGRYAEGDQEHDVGTQDACHITGWIDVDEGRENGCGLNGRQQDAIKLPAS